MTSPIPTLRSTRERRVHSSTLVRTESVNRRSGNVNGYPGFSTMHAQEKDRSNASSGPFVKGYVRGPLAVIFLLWKSLHRQTRPRAFLTGQVHGLVPQ